MLAYAFRRVLLAVFMVWVVSFCSFCAFGLSFDPLYQYNLCGDTCKTQREGLAAQFHLHDPILQRYWYWLSGLVHHGFGTTVPRSFGQPGVPLGPQLWRSADVTAQLMAAGLVLTVVFSVLIGVVSAKRRGGATDVLLRLFAYVVWSLPTFLIGVLLYRWFEPTSWFTRGSAPGGGLVPWLRAMTLPAVTLSLGLIGLYSRYVRTATLTELQRPYVTVARAKGLRESRVTMRHLLRNAAGPFVSVLALDIGAVVGASLAADWVFRLGGLAWYFYAAIQISDPFALTAVVVIVAAVVAAFMLVSDLALAWLDPRIRATAIGSSS